MHPHSVNPAPTQPRSARLWIVETLVVLGVVGFGYFALTLDPARVTPRQAPPRSPRPPRQATP